MAARKGLSGRRKAAIMLISVGTELSAEIFQHLEQEEIEALTLEIVSVGKITPEVRENILKEFCDMHLAQEYIAAGGIEYAEQVLEKALGTNKAKEVLNKVVGMLKTSPFDVVKNTPPEQLLNFIENEHPQTIALVLSYLPAANAATILGALPQEVQSDVAMRVALMEGTSPEVLKEIERVLERKLSTYGAREVKEAGGVKSLVEILNSVDRSTERAILDRLEEENPEIADEVRKSMFVFEDIALLDDRSLQLVLREIDLKDLAMSLKVATDDVKNKFFRCMSERASSMLKEDMEFLGAVRLRNVEEAQQRIVAQVRKLEESGQIQISRGGREDEFVS